MSQTLLVEIFRNRVVLYDPEDAENDGLYLAVATQQDVEAAERAVAALRETGLWSAARPAQVPAALRRTLAAGMTARDVLAWEAEAARLTALRADAPEANSSELRWEAWVAVLDDRLRRVESAFEHRRFRDALGQFATGVTVVTARGLDGGPMGITANSFAAVSLDPPLVLWSPAKSSWRHRAFTAAEHYVIHILDRRQEWVSALFATPGRDPFPEVAWSWGETGAPVLDDYAACFQCVREAVYDGGDHSIVVGRVLALDFRTDATPLLFHRGRYTGLAD